MSGKTCGHCDYHEGVRPGEIECLVFSAWFDKNHSCEQFKEYSHSKTLEIRAAEALYVKKALDAKASAKSEQEFAERMAQKDRDHDDELQRQRMAFDKRLWRASWWWQALLVIGGAVLGFLLSFLFGK